jgi:type I restriction-modification system DNA methylase subunit
MNQAALQSILSEPYNYDVWIQVLRSTFGIRQIYQVPQNILLPSNDLADSAVEIAQGTTADERLIGVYQIQVKPNVRLEQNKVGLRKLLRNVYQQVDVALIVFVQGDKWRFSYVADIGLGEFKQQTEPKRYTYLLGSGENCRTAAERFEKLQGRPLTINDLFDAFSVEKLSKDFFKTYKLYFEQFTAHLYNTPNYRLLLLNNAADLPKGFQDENAKPIRDFAKKLLGRMVFLQFLQKKGWMGVTSGSTIWKNGDKRFTQMLFERHVEAAEKTTFHSRVLKTLFFETLNTKRDNDNAPVSLGANVRVPYLNGGLFDKDIAYEHDFDFPTNLFAGLFDFFEQYNFTIDENDPLDSEVGIDPEMLGHIFENLLEENREKGAFYTPKDIVKYMCQECLIEYLTTNLTNPNTTNAQTNIFRSDATDLVRYNKVSDTFAVRENALGINKLLQEIKICDPAIGSGAFPMGLLKEIFECRRLLYGYLKKNDAFDPALVKKQIIQHNIYGIDLENGAVDIARLRFWLALVVDETVPQPLPNLDYKIMQGNSLLETFGGIDLSKLAKQYNNVTMVQEPERDLFGNIQRPQMNMFTDNAMLKIDDLQDMISTFFNETNPLRKAELRRKINDIVHNHIDYNLELRENQLTRFIKEALQGSTKLKSTDKRKLDTWQNDLKNLKTTREELHRLQTAVEKPYFLWHLWFSDVFEGGGFDVVIGNPPYVQLQKGGGYLAALYENQGFATFTRMGDIYSLFYEKGVNMLAPKGILCYITSNKWMRTNYGESTRQFFVEKTQPLLLIDFGSIQVFETATVDTNILMLQKPAAKHEKTAPRALRLEKDFDITTQALEDYVKQKHYLMPALSHTAWVVGEKDIYDIKGQVEAQGTPLADWDITINRGILTGYNGDLETGGCFIITAEKRAELIAADPRSAEIIKPILRGKDIKAWYPEFADLYVINTNNGWLLKKPYKIDRDKKVFYKTKNATAMPYKRIEPAGKDTFRIDRIIVETDYPTIYAHLQKYQTELEKRSDKGEHWTNLRNCAYDDDFQKPKIIYPNMTKFMPFVYDEKEHFYCNDKGFILTGENLKYLTCFFNSKLFKYCFSDNFPELQGGTRELRKVFFDKIPVKPIDAAEAVAFERLVDYLVALKQHVLEDMHDRMMPLYFEQVVNALVYEYYLPQAFADAGLSVRAHLLDLPLLRYDADAEDILLQLRRVYISMHQEDGAVRQAVFRMTSIAQIRLIHQTIQF